VLSYFTKVPSLQVQPFQLNHPQDKSLETVEAMVPKFYRNAKDIYKKNASNKDVTQTNKNPNKKKLSDKVRKYLVTTML